MASTPTRDLQDEFLAATRKSQEAVLRAARAEDRRRQLTAHQERRYIYQAICLT